MVTRDSQQEAAVGKRVRSTARLLSPSRQPFRRRLLLFLAWWHRLPYKGCHSIWEAGLRHFPMKVIVSVLSWVWMEKPEGWWHLVLVALCAGGRRNAPYLLPAVLLHPA